MYRSIALPTVSEAGVASAFIPAFIAAALDSAAFFVGSVMDIRLPSTIRPTRQFPDGSFCAFGIFIYAPSCIVGHPRRGGRFLL